MGLFDRALAGEGSALARMATLLENDDSATLAALDALGAPATSPHIIGLTGPPGAGKSSLINALLPYLTNENGRIAVLLVDPSSQTSGGAVLGDRVRMLSWGDDRIFIRSQATRGQEGGLAPSTGALIDLFGHLRFGMVLIETVGVGQDGIDVRKVCDTTIVVQSPHMGDAVQSLKAGILEIADLFVVTKSDLAGSHNTVRDLNAMIQIAHPEKGSWVPSVVPVSATGDDGLDRLTAAISDHRVWLRNKSNPERRRVRLDWETEKRATALIRRALRTTQPGPLDGTRYERLEQLLRQALDGLGPPR